MILGQNMQVIAALCVNTSLTALDMHDHHGDQACFGGAMKVYLYLHLALLCKGLPDAVLGRESSEDALGSLDGQPQALCHRHPRDSLLPWQSHQLPTSALLMSHRLS